MEEKEHNGNGAKTNKKSDFQGQIREVANACAHARWSWLGHPTLFNVTLTSKPCVQALNADRMEQVFI